MSDIFLSHLQSILSLSAVILISLISPGPDFAVVVKNSLIYSRKTGLLTALGIALGILLHVSYTLLGLGIIISKITWLFLTIKYLGASYLIYIGYRGVTAKKSTVSLGHTIHKQDISSIAAISSGFFTNALNPKCMLLFISVFSVIIPHNTPTIVLLLYGTIIFIETLLWFSLVAFCLSGKSTREKFRSASHWIERITGAILIALGLRIFFMQ
ncbi:MAG: LysE family transporter [Alphaproteobacteria bacterium]|jgi:RhtB (resistance to homoserine/threonine) family protein|nr:LysE family transporter [Candidatus Jidaibacter sp.]